MDHWKDFLDEAKANRDRFLRSHRTRFEKTGDPKIIVKLIKLEPSHLNEEWIRKEFIQWIRRGEIDLLNAAVIEQTGRTRPTEQQRKKMIEDHFLYLEIERIRARLIAKQKKIDPNTKRQFIGAAIRKLGEYTSENAPIEAESVIKNRYHNHKKVLKRREKNRELPFPFYGHDLEERNGKVVLILPAHISLEKPVVLSPERTKWERWDPKRSKKSRKDGGLKR